MIAKDQPIPSAGEAQQAASPTRATRPFVPVRHLDLAQLVKIEVVRDIPCPQQIRSAPTHILEAIPNDLALFLGGFDDRRQFRRQSGS